MRCYLLSFIIAAMAFCAGAGTAYFVFSQPRAVPTDEIFFPEATHWSDEGYIILADR